MSDVTDNSGWALWRPQYDDAQNSMLEALIWLGQCEGQARSVHSDPDQCGGEGCDTSLNTLGFDFDDFAPGATSEAVEDLHGFVMSCLAERPNCFDQITADMVGYDFVLTRNGHGAGFWDRGLGEMGDWLTSMCKPYGDQGAYVGDDGSLYIQ